MRGLSPSLTVPDEVPVPHEATVRLARVVAVDLTAGTVQVATGDVQSAAIPFSTGRQGATRIWSPPSVGEQVVLLCPGGDIEGAIAIGAIAQNLFPLAGDSNRELIAFADGAVLAYDPETSHLEFRLPVAGRVTITAPDGVDLQGDLSVAGKITATGDVKAGDISLQDHKHSGVQAGGSLTGAAQ